MMRGNFLARKIFSRNESFELKKISNRGIAERPNQDDKNFAASREMLYGDGSVRTVTGDGKGPGSAVLVTPFDKWVKEFCRSGDRIIVVISKDVSDNVTTTLYSLVNMTSGVVYVVGGDHA